MFVFDEELFTSSFNKIKDAQEEFDTMQMILDSLSAESAESVFKGDVNNIINRINITKNLLNELYEDIQKTNNIIRFMNSGLYTSGEIDIDLFLMLKDLIDSNKFGANQSGTMMLLEKAISDYDSLTDLEKKKYADLLKIFEKYNFLTKEGTWNNTMYEFMYEAEYVGCGFAANVNIIVDRYSKMENGEELFFEKYGFPLYYKNASGERVYNYETLFASHFLESMDAYSKQVFPGVNIEIPDFWPKWNPSFISKYMNITGGTIASQRESALQNAFDDSTITNTSYNLQKNFEQYASELSNHDYAVIEAHNFTVTGLNGRTYSFNGGHFMAITGVTPTGKYIVASWGDQYILDSAAFANVNFIDFR